MGGSPDTRAQITSPFIPFHRLTGVTHRKGWGSEWWRGVRGRSAGTRSMLHDINEPNAGANDVPSANIGISIAESCVTSAGGPVSYNFIDLG